MKKLKLIISVIIILITTSCITVYKESTVMQYKGKAELMTDSVKISVSNIQLVED